MRIETKRRVWMLYRVPWRWWPEVYNQTGCTWSACWGCLAIECLSKEWLDYCERKGAGLGSMMEYVVAESLPELTADERAKLDEFPADAVDHWWRGEKWVDGQWIKPEVNDE